MGQTVNSFAEAETRIGIVMGFNPPRSVYVFSKLNQIAVSLRGNMSL